MDRPLIVKGDVAVDFENKFFSLVSASQTNVKSPPFGLGVKEKPKGKSQSLKTWTEKLPNYQYN